MAKVQVGLVQMSCTADKQENLDKAIVKIREIAAQGAQIVCLQELFTSLYFCDEEDYTNFKLAEAIPGPSTDVLSKVPKFVDCRSKDITKRLINLEERLTLDIRDYL